jgi:hypothetical protein
MGNPQAIVVTSIELICDAAGCGHVELVEAITSDLIGRSCPKCGADLLTAEDFKNAKTIETAVSICNDLIPMDQSQEESKAGLVCSINPHAGDLNITVKGL